MITKKQYMVYDKKTNSAKYKCLGWFLFGVIPIYVIRFVIPKRRLL